MLKPFDPNRICWTVQHFAAETDLSENYVRQMIALQMVDSVKIGGRRLITTPPRVFISRYRAKVA